MASNSMNEKVNASYLTRRKNAKQINYIEVVDKIKYLGVIVQAKRNVFEGQKNEMMKKSKDWAWWQTLSS